MSGKVQFTASRGLLENVWVERKGHYYVGHLTRFGFEVVAFQISEGQMASLAKGKTINVTDRMIASGHTILSRGY
jgi:hypothetical protein